VDVDHGNRPFRKKKAKKPSSTASLTVRLDADSKNIVAKAVALRQISVSDYVRL